MTSKLYPEVIDRVRVWEQYVSLCSKRQSSTFFQAATLPGVGVTRARIDNAVRWSKTLHGGKQYSILKALELIESEAAA